MAKFHLTEEQKRFYALPHEAKVEIFWSLVAYPGNADDCWEWQGERNEKGYGKFSLLDETVAYRIAYRLVKGSIEPGMRLLHSCDNPPCCNPYHLSQGTHLDNMRDKIAKGRQWRGGSVKKRGYFLRPAPPRGTANRRNILMNEVPRILSVLIEYSPSEGRVFVRGVWQDSAPAWDLPPLAPENVQNFVKVFEGIDMKRHIGISGLPPAPGYAGG